MSWKYASNPTAAERVTGGLCYFTFGLAGIIYIALSGRHSQSDVFRFHFLQSILLSILGVLFNWAMSLFSQSFLPALGDLGTNAALAMNLLSKAAYLLLLYGMIAAFMGKYAEIPLVSVTVRRQL